MYRLIYVLDVKSCIMMSSIQRKRNGDNRMRLEKTTRRYSMQPIKILFPMMKSLIVLYVYWILRLEKELS